MRAWRSSTLRTHSSRHTGFLAARIPALPGTRPALHRRTGLLQAHQRSRKAMMEASGTTAKDYQWAVFHQPNTKFPQRAASQLGFSRSRSHPAFSRRSSATPMRGCHHWPDCHPGCGQTGRPHPDGLVRFWAGSDAFDLRVTEKLPERRDKAPKTQDYIARRTEIDYATMPACAGRLR